MWYESTSNRTSISIHAYATLTRARFAHPRPRVMPGVCILLCSFYYFSSSLVTREKVQGDTFSRAIKLAGGQARLNRRYLRPKLHSWSIVKITSRISYHKDNSIILIISIIVTLTISTIILILICMFVFEIICENRRKERNKNLYLIT